MSAEPAAGAGLRLLRCRGDSELQQARAFRDEVFLSRRNLVLSSDLERLRDANSEVFLLLENGTVVASVRALPYPSPLSAVSTAGEGGVLDADSEVGRLTAARSAGRARYSVLALWLAATWMLDCTAQRRYVAHCPPGLLKLYRLLGAQDTGRTMTLPGRSDVQCVILGCYEDCLQRGRQTLGMRAAEARAAVRFAVEDGPADLHRSA